MHVGAIALHFFAKQWIFFLIKYFYSDNIFYQRNTYFLMANFIHVKVYFCIISKRI